jgi:alkyl sulfatase BDS1-like metallo-beta-lactamase superfamily hydrolase
LIAVALPALAAEPPAHFHPKGKPPSPFTVAAQQAWRSSLPLADKADFEDAARGFIAAPASRQIRGAAGNVVWNIGSYDWLLPENSGGRNFDSIHPSLQRQALLNMGYGLYEVVPGKIYQVRGFDLANISFIRGATGWIVFDTGTTRETARAALDFVNEKLGKRPVTAVVYSHAHADHFGGVRGVVDEADVKSGKVPVIAPVGFSEHAVAENVHAGPAMNRRIVYQYGLLLPRNPFGHVDQAIGKNVPLGTIGLIEPTRIISKPYESLTVDGVTMEFQNTPGTESPAEMNTWFPEWKAFWAAENVTGTIHNIYTLRGALIRDPLEWSKKINEALYRYGTKAEVMFAAHNWPRFGNARIQQVMRDQRDAYAHLNNAVLHLANQGVTINEVHNVYRLPAGLQRSWAAHSYHGSEEHNSRAVINRYLGYWDANPATLTPLSPRESAPEYVAMMGGADRILRRARQLFDEGRYLLAVELLDKLVYAEPRNQAAKDLLADCFEQIGYQKESSSLRNSFLAAALDLRSGMPNLPSPKTGGPDMIRATSTELWLEFLAIRLDPQKVADLAFAANLVTPDTGEQFAIELRNSALTSIKGQQVANPDFTVTIKRSDLEAVMAGSVLYLDLVAQGRAQFAGSRELFDRFRGSLVVFPANFEIMPGTAPAGTALPPTTVPSADPLRQEPLPASPGG